MKSGGYSYDMLASSLEISTDEEDSSKVKVDFEYKGFEYRFSLNMLDFRNELLDIFGNLWKELWDRGLTEQL